VKHSYVNKPAEIWVAKGVYYPDVGSDQLENDEDSTFMITDGVALYSGFSFGDTNFSDRDWKNNLTVLSGDLKQDDTNTNGVVLTTSHIVDDNARHVVTAIEVSGTAVLDGFTITAGDADENNDPDYWGGGFICYGLANRCHPTLKNIKFSGNYAEYDGGAMFNFGQHDGSSSPTLENVEFSGNSAGDDGGAMYNNGDDGISSPMLNNVVFSGNLAGDDGGAMHNDGSDSGTSSPTLIDVEFSSNSSHEGGAMYNEGDVGNNKPRLTRVIFSGNSATYGGAMFNDGDEGSSNPTLHNVLFSGNSAIYDGGAMLNDGSDKGQSKPILNNVTFSGNSAHEEGGAIYNYGDHMGTCSPQIRNSILWNNQDISGTGSVSSTIFNDSATAVISNSLVQGTGASGGGWIGGSYVDGGGNIDTDPMFITPVEPSSAPTTDGDLHLKEGSPAIDVGNNLYIDCTGVLSDLDGEARKVDGNKDGVSTVDMGAFEKQLDYQFDVYTPIIFH